MGIRKILGSISEAKDYVRNVADEVVTEDIAQKAAKQKAPKNEPKPKDPPKPSFAVLVLAGAFALSACVPGQAMPSVPSVVPSCDEPAPWCTEAGR